MALILVETEAALLACAAKLAGAAAIALDTEADSMHSYFHRTCLLQISAGDTDFIIDLIVLDPAPLAGIFAAAGTEKIVHAAENDIRTLKRDFGFALHALFDTMVAARILGYPRWGLADLLRDAFGVELDKQYQRFDWSQRPLPRPAITYAAEDTHHLAALRRKLGDELEREGRLEEATEEFARLEATPPGEHGFDSNDFWRVKGSHDLDPGARPRLRELYALRDQFARRANRPPFRIMPDTTLVAVAAAAPRTQAELDRLNGVSPYIAQRYGRALLTAVRRAEGQPPIQRPRSVRDDALIARFEALRQWRNRRATERNVEGEVIVSNAVLKALAATPPSDLAGLTAAGLLGPWKLRTYGEEIVLVLRQHA
ncbi:MAG: ribonuclease D [Dehalococcoidia bacterium]